MVGHPSNSWASCYRLCRRYIQSINQSIKYLFQATRPINLHYSNNKNKIRKLYKLYLLQYRRVTEGETDGRTDGRTDGQTTTANTALA